MENSIFIEEKLFKISLQTLVFLTGFHGNITQFWLMYIDMMKMQYQVDTTVQKNKNKKN